MKVDKQRTYYKITFGLVNLVVDLFGKAVILGKKYGGTVSDKLIKYVAMLFFCGLSGCASVSSEPQEEDKTILESYNRAMFSFNDKLDKFIIRPVAKGYRAVTNEFIRERVSNFFNNIDEPISAVNHILQGDFKNTGNNLGRFTINTTLGGAGLFDVASKVGLEKKKTGFDETLATWCVPDGPFIILPVFGPSTPRAAAGFVADGYTSPMYWVANESGGEDKWLAYYSASGLKYINIMAENIKFLESLEEGAVDYYETVKSAYLQNRGKLKKCSDVAKDAAPEYDFDMGDMEDE